MKIRISTAAAIAMFVIAPLTLSRAQATAAAPTKCTDGTTSNAVGRGACSGHGGVKKADTKTAPAAAKADTKTAPAKTKSADTKAAPAKTKSADSKVAQSSKPKPDTKVAPAKTKSADTKAKTKTDTKAADTKAAPAKTKPPTV